MVALPVQREGTTHHGFYWLCHHLLGALNNKIAGAFPSLVCRLISGSKCCVKISRAIESCMLSHLLLFFPLLFSSVFSFLFFFFLRL